MTVRRRTAAFRSALQEHFVTSGGFTGGEHGDLLTDDVERRCVLLSRDDEWFCRHVITPDSIVMIRSHASRWQVRFLPTRCGGVRSCRCYAEGSDPSA